MKRKPPPKKANPLEPLLCNHCDHRGLRYQGSRQRAKGVAKVYKCESCERTSHNPVAERLPESEPEPVELCPHHWVPRDFMARAYRIQTMSWRAGA